MLMDFGTIANAKAIAASLREAGIAVRSFTDPMIASCLRFCAADDATTEQLVTAVRSTLSNRRVNGDRTQSGHL